MSREVYYAYHKAREAERYQNRVIRQIEMSLERFQEEGVNAEYRVVRSSPGIEEEMIRAEDNRRLYQALDELNVEERLLIDALFFSGTVSYTHLKKLRGSLLECVRSTLHSK